MSFSAEYTDLVALFSHGIAQYASRPLFGTRTVHGWRWTTYREFGQLVDQARSGLRALGVQAGDRVAVISNNRLEWATSAYAAYTAGATHVPMYEAQLDKEWLYILRDSGSKVCLTGNDAIAARVRELQQDLPELHHVISFASEWQPLLERGAQAPIEPARPRESDLAALFYTSGTTGNPKGVMLTHRNMAANINALKTVAPVHADDRSLAFLPWAHVFGGCIELSTVFAIGSSMAICDDTSKLLDYLPEVRPTMLFAVPRIWNRIYDGVHKQMEGRPKVIRRIFERGLRAESEQKRGAALGLRDRTALQLARRLIFRKVIDRFGGRLRFAFSGAAALSAEVGEFIDNLGIHVYEGYGMTESTGSTTANLPGATRLGSVGKPIPGVTITIDKDAAGASENEGEVIIYGPGVMAGYYNQPEATANTLTADGGLRSGDLGHLDDEGFLYITGRVKELYKLQNGKYVAPAPLEEQLQLSPLISQAVLYGADRPHNVALIVPDMPSLKEWAQSEQLPTEGPDLLAHPRTQALIRAEIDKHSREFKGYESVRDFLLEDEELSTQNGMLTPTLKVKRQNVLARYGPRLEALYRG